MRSQHNSLCPRNCRRGEGPAVMSSGSYEMASIRAAASAGPNLADAICAARSVDRCASAISAAPSETQLARRFTRRRRDFTDGPRIIGRARGRRVRPRLVSPFFAPRADNVARGLRKFRMVRDVLRVLETCAVC